MKYYRVKPQYDNKMKLNKHDEYAGIYIANELYTEKEAARQNLNPAFVELVEISKNNTYWFFGARFENKEG